MIDQSVSKAIAILTDWNGISRRSHIKDRVIDAQITELLIFHSQRSKVIAKLRLAANTDSHAEPVIISLMDH